MSRSRLNCTVIELEPSELVEVSSVTPAIRENCRSSGVVTLAAMVSALAPGRVAETWMVGKSTCGSGAIGSIGKLTSANHQQSGRQQRRPDRTADERFGDAHFGAGVVGGAAADVVDVAEVAGAAAGTVERRCGGHPDGRAGAKLQLAVDHDLVAGGKSGFDHRHRAASHWPPIP